MRNGLSLAREAFGDVMSRSYHLPCSRDGFERLRGFPLNGSLTPLGAVGVAQPVRVLAENAAYLDPIAVVELGPAPFCVMQCSGCNLHAARARSFFRSGRS